MYNIQTEDENSSTRYCERSTNGSIRYFYDISDPSDGSGAVGSSHEESDRKKVVKKISLQVFFFINWLEAYSLINNLKMLNIIFRSCRYSIMTLYETVFFQEERELTERPSTWRG